MRQGLSGAGTPGHQPLQPVPQPTGHLRAGGVPPAIQPTPPRHLAALALPCTAQLRCRSHPMASLPPSRPPPLNPTPCLASRRPLRPPPTQAFHSPSSAIPRLVRAFSAGVIVALALVHIVPEALVDLSELSEFPWGGTAVVMGLVGLVVLEHAAHLMRHRQASCPLGILGLGRFVY